MGFGGFAFRNLRFADMFSEYRRFARSQWDCTECLEELIWRRSGKAPASFRRTLWSVLPGKPSSRKKQTTTLQSST